MTKAADIVGPIILTVLASQVTNRDQFAVTQVAIEVMKKSRNAPRFEKERYEGFIYSNSYEVQYSSYVNVTADGFVVLKRVVKTESFALQDTLAGSSSDEPFFTSVASITVQVRDVDNRPPWFQPCQRSSLGLAKLYPWLPMVTSGYHWLPQKKSDELLLTKPKSPIDAGCEGVTNLSDPQEGPLVLEPGPVYAKDGDRNRSEQISYRILR
ncbi:unnamed protein product, partial [Menidia menidia]